MKMQERVLGYCNRIRKELGKKPVKKLKKGDDGRSISCPIANTIGDVQVFAHELHFRNSTKADKEHPKYIKDFIKNIDKGLYPELILKEKNK